MSFITKIVAYEVFDSRGFPTVRVHCYTQAGALGVAMVPSGASTGSKEALELRDNDSKRLFKKGVLKAVQNVNEFICPELLGREVTHQTEIDQALLKLDGTKNKSKLGANAILGASLAVAKAAAQERKVPLYQYLGGLQADTLPVPMINVINGGAHANNYLDFQEFMLVPVGAKTFRQAIVMGSEIFHTLKNLLKVKGYSTSVGDEGGFAPKLANAEEALDLLKKAVLKANYSLGVDGVMFALDVAASEFYDVHKQKYVYIKESQKNPQKPIIERTSAEQLTYLAQLVKKYPIISIEDGFDENDVVGFQSLIHHFKAQKGPASVQSVGDDLFVTNPVIVQKGITQQWANSVLIKLNQIGTLTETIQTIKLTQKASWSSIISHRSGETEDTTIADLAVAFNTGFIKTGSLSRSERVAKYNRLLMIEHELGRRACYLGIRAFGNLMV